MPRVPRTTLTLASGTCGAGWMVTPRSFLIDRVVADCEEIRLPAKRVAGGTLSVARGPLDAVPPVPRGRLGRLRRLLGPGRRQVEDAVLIDLRLRDPQNWAHFLTNHLPLVFALAEEAGLDWSDLLLLLPRATPDHVRRAAAFFGFRVLCTDARVTGQGIAFEVRPWNALRPVRAEWVRSPRVQAALAAAPTPTPRVPLPARVFLSRRDTRRLSNEAEIAARLGPRGFETVYPEDLSVADQFRLFAGAEEVVAIHGAGLAPLLYRPPGAPPARIVELFSCGHVTDVFRVVAGQVGCDWVGVRGRLRPEHVRPAQDLDRAFLAYSLQDFEVDPASLDRAFEILDHAATDARSVSP